MATLLVHVIDPKKTAGAELLAALDDIQRNHRLVCNQGWGGWGAYAHFAGQVPAPHLNDPMAVIEAEPGVYQTVAVGARRFALLRPPKIGEPYVSVRFLGFINAPAGFLAYSGPRVI